MVSAAQHSGNHASQDWSPLCITRTTRHSLSYVLKHLTVSAMPVDTEPMGLDPAFEREKWQADLRLRERDLELREAEQQLKRLEFRCKSRDVRLKLLKIGALVRISVRRIKVAMASGCPAATTWGLAAVRLAAVANPRASPV
jgi:hypothetical protein